MFADIFYSQFSSIKRFSIKGRSLLVYSFVSSLAVGLFIFVLSKFNYNKEEADGPNGKFMVGGTIY